MRLAKIVASAAVAGAALLSLAAPASATNPPYDGCPDQAICLYKNGGGTGSKVIIGGSFSPGSDGIVSLQGVNFLDGTSSINQVSSWINKTNCQIDFFDAIIPAENDGYMDTAPSYHYGLTRDWANTGNNDRLSSLHVHCW
ncbi:peptidase inhibitor family I36 protein [Streptomyces flaveolus]|uniref:peptidase inhibitor family I36 protein n=1 Tax=Streptomyces flaveolus TaxID=67297 RepID=UPI003424C175